MLRAASRNAIKAWNKKKLNRLQDKRETKKMNGLAEAGEQRGERKDFKGRERNYREEKRGGGLVMGERWQDIEVSERGKWEPVIEGESEKKKKRVQNKIVIQREGKQRAKWLDQDTHRRSKTRKLWSWKQLLNEEKLGATLKTGDRTETLKTKPT